MGNENDIKDANQGGPAFDIPDLKKKEKERKKSGVAVGGGTNPGAAGFQGAKAAASAASSASSASSSILAGFASTLAGKAVLAGAAALVLGGGGLGVLSMLRGGGGPAASADLGGLESSIKVRTRRADRTTYLDHRGEVAFEAAKPGAKPDAAKAGQAAAGAAAKVGDVMENGTIGGVQDGENKDKLEHNLSGAKLSSSMGGSFGAKNVFAGNSAAPKFSDMSKSALKAPSGGRSTAMKQSRGGASSSRRAARRISANKAIGELRLVGGLSQQATRSATSEASATNATNAFEGQNTEGGVTPQAEMPDTPPTVMGGGGGGGGGGGSAQSIQNNEQMLAMLAMMMRMAADLKMQGEKMREYAKYMMIIGIALLCTGEPISQSIGAVLLGLGLMLDDMGKGMIKMGDDMIAGVKNQAAAQAAATGDTHQQNVTNYCADQAIANGTDPNDCDPPEDIDHQQELSDLEQREIERQNRVDDTEVTP